MLTYSGLTIGLVHTSEWERQTQLGEEAKDTRSGKSVEESSCQLQVADA